MPNEEPEGPNLPPKKLDTPNAVKSATTTIETPKIADINKTEIKGIIGAIAGAFLIISYLFYYYWYYENGIKLNELYFIATGVGISVFTGLLFTFFQNIYVKTILLFTSVFYLMLEVIYIAVWIVQGEAYAYIKLSLVIGLVIGLIYFLYEQFANKSRRVN